MNRTAPASLALLIGLTLSGCAAGTASEPVPAAGSASASSQQPSPDPTSASAVAPDSGESGGKPTAEEDPAKEGAWIDHAAYSADAGKYHESSNVVLFFNASWCPTCRNTVKSLDADGAPAGLTVVSVDFDDASELRRKYGVTVQHTFVQVDEDGKALTKFTGPESGAEIAARTS